MSNPEDVMSAAPSIGPPAGLPLSCPPRPGGLNRLDTHERAIAELTVKTDEHGKAILELKTQDGIWKRMAQNRDEQFSRVESSLAAHTSAINDFASLGAVMRELVTATSESNRLRRKQRNEFEKAADKIVDAVKSPRTLAAITVGAAVGGFALSLIESCLK